MQNKLSAILTELKSHAPFTFLGALTGVVCMFLFKGLDHDTTEKLFYVFHPAHVFLSALVTASVFSLHSKRRSMVIILLVGIFGSIGVSTLSDSVIPYVGELLLGREIQVHQHAEEQQQQQQQQHNHTTQGEPAHDHSILDEMHIGFIEGWHIVIPVAIIGTLIAYFRPRTKLPHAGHVLLSTWASTFHMLMAFGGQIPPWKLAGSLAFLFLAVWLPCCISDIVFPLIFADSCEAIGCHHHKKKDEAEQ